MRIKELLLIILIFFTTAAAFFVLLPEPNLKEVLIESAKINFSFLLLSLILNLTAKGSNELLLPTASALTNLGLINLYQIKPSYYSIQLRNLYAAVIIFLAVSFLVKNGLELFRYKYIFGVLSIIFFLAPIFFGKEVYGARLWISFLGVSFQPSEIARVFFFIFLAGYFGEHVILLEKESGLSFSAQLIYFIPVLLMTGFSLLSLVLVKDLGYSFLLLATLLAVIYIVGAKRIYILSSIAVFGAGTYAAYHFFSHVKARIDAWLYPWKNPYGKSYQVIQSLFAYAEGGITGKGLGKGFPYLIPAAHTDMVLPVFAEAAGFLGSIIVLGLITILSLIIFLEASRHNDARTKIFFALTGFSFFLQAFLVAAGSTLLLPLTGLTIPFFSYGGSSLLGSFLTLLICLKLSAGRSKWIVS